MTYADLIIIAIILLCVLIGFVQGLIVEIATTLGAVVALGVARLEYMDVRHLLMHVVHKSTWLTPIAFLIVFLIVWLGIIFLAGKVRTVVRLLFLGWLDRLGGMVFGFVQGLIVVELLLYIGKRVQNKSLHHAVKHSVLGPKFQHILPFISRWFPHLPRIPHFNS